MIRLVLTIIAEFAEKRLPVDPKDCGCLAMVVMMLFRPAGLMPSAVRKRELAAPKEGA